MTEILKLLGSILVVFFGYFVLLVLLEIFFPKRCPKCLRGRLEVIGGLTLRGPRRLQGMDDYRIWKCKECDCAFVDRNGKLSMLTSDDPYNEAHEIVFGRHLPKNITPPE